MNSLIQLFTTILPFSKEEQIFINENLITESYEKGDYHCIEGKTCKKLSFIENGIFSVEGYRTIDDSYIKYFASQGHFAVDLDSFFHQTPSKENIKALTNCELLTISRETYNMFEKEITNFSKVISFLKEKALLEKYTIKSEMLVDNAETRYLKFIKRHPEVANQIPQKLIATHLGISQFTLSRIRAKK